MGFARPTRAAGVTVLDLPDGEAAVLRPDGDGASLLNATGAAIFHLCDGARTPAEIAAFICDHVRDADPARVRDDVDAMLARLVDAGVIEEGPRR
jgi:hypothetical protein